MSLPTPPSSHTKPITSAQSLPARFAPETAKPASFAGHKVTKQEPIPKQIPQPEEQKISKSKRLKNKLINAFSIKPAPPQYKYHATVSSGNQTTHIWTNSPNLKVWTPDPKARMQTNAPAPNFHHFNQVPYQGNLSQMMIPGLGVLNFNQPVFYQQMSSQPPVWHPPAQLTAQLAPPIQYAKPAPVYNHIYQDEAARLNIAKTRFTERFHISEATVKKLEQKSDIEQRKFSELPQGINSVVAQLKSTHLKQISSALNNHQTNLAHALPNTHTSIEEQGKTFVNNLESGMRAIDVILKTGQQYYSKEDIQTFKDIRRQLSVERSLVVQVMMQSDANGLGDKLNWQTATDFMRVGYQLIPATVEHLSTLDDSSLETSKPFGKGMTHTVSKLTYKHDGAETKKLFKAEDAVDKSGYERITKKGAYLDSSRPQFALRNLAAQNLQPLLGLNMVPKMELATHKGQIGLMMDEAKGTTAFPTAKSGISEKLKNNTGFANNVVSDLIKAEWFDCLCGQKDRHPGNYLINPDTGHVSLIDNDQSFYPGDTSVAKNSTAASEGNWRSPWPGLPALIDRETFTRLQAIKEQDIRQKLSGLLGKSEVDSTLKRLEELKQHAIKLEKEGKVIDDWSSWKNDAKPALGASDFLKQHGKQQSYLNALEGALKAKTVSVPPAPKQAQPSFSSLR
ncbi:hypothetical protein EOPP23_07505 [Endozoicomonas sp. OPT23]|uniref:hypothetical protein n=1 Tax=Endozoicomonas sp. OPT23 TaxID=2072845 RepID=UPI00129A6C09|nr:hypothetical protein [Endozoicomonas sp. OPT23]MRI32829.1 hypothetical protein [Endozoicomonas sp. OPT23]